jgi:hypothetical protein
VDVGENSRGGFDPAQDGTLFVKWQKTFEEISLRGRGFAQSQILEAVVAEIAPCGKQPDMAIRDEKGG